MNYKATLNLPKTTLPMKANLPTKEPEYLARWEKERLYEKLLSQAADRPLYVLHDGPPYANGHIHIGHALNKILKDIIVRSKFMEGFRAPYVPGWDCHGLPIEHQVDKALGKQKASVAQEEIRRRCRQYAEKYVDIQRQEFKRLGVLGDWEHPYLTMDFGYEATIVREFGRFVASGGVYKGKKPVHWCSRCETALAEAEVEYADHESPSVYVKFPVARDPHGRLPGFPEKAYHVLIWTTTPWTLPANLAIAAHPEFRYRLVQIGQDVLILAEALVAPAMQACGISGYRVLESVLNGRELEGIVCRNPLVDRDSPLILGEHVTLDAGTGCVHTAPGHGQEDYDMGLRYGLDIYAPVDHKGRFTQEVPAWAGMNVFEANPRINTALREKGALLKEEAITHSYPHCWRCKSPVIFRATEQWFISMDTGDLRQRALEQIRRVAWIPRWGKDRIQGMMENRPDWCISRQRSWGVPITVLRCTACGEHLMDAAFIEHVAQVVEKEGADAWFTLEAADLLPSGTVCPSCGKAIFAKETDILDVWFDSGVSHAAVLRTHPELRWPADLYLEGSDQHRGWFQSSLLAAVGTAGEAPYRAVLTHGFVMDGEGKKMSKSAGNVVAPQEVIAKHGAEILRLWVSAEDYRDDVRISGDILTQLAEAFRRIRNTCRYLLGNLSGFDPARDSLPNEALLDLDQWALLRLQRMVERVRDAYQRMEFHQVFHTLNTYCAVDLSALYLDILKDRLYCGGRGTREHRSAQTALHRILQALVRLMAPILPFTAEEVWDHLPLAQRSEASVHLTLFPEVETHYLDAEMEARWDRLLRLREEVAKPLEAARKSKAIGGSLEAAVDLYAEGELFDFIKAHKSRLGPVFIVSQVTLSPLETAPQDAWSSPVMKALRVRVRRADGEKCIRCWMYSPSVGVHSVHPELCERCVGVVEAHAPIAATAQETSASPGSGEGVS